MNILITGVAGFIGFHIAKILLEQGDNCVGLDNLNDYYDVALKKSRLAQLKNFDNFTFEKCDLANREKIESIFNHYKFQKVVHLGAQAGVRYSMDHPHCYVQSNIVGFLHILEGCRHHHIEHLVYASTSSVYGAHTKQPFSESEHVDHPLALYAATKKSNELMAHSYASLYQLPVTGLRFFTVYGPWGRPDMALFLFTKKILNNQPIEVFNHGQMMRDFTYIDDVVEGIKCVLDKPAQPDSKWNSKQPDCATSYAPYRIYNIGNSQPVALMDYIHALEQALKRKVLYTMLPMRCEEVQSTFADVSRLEHDFHYKPQTSIQEGIGKFVDWYLSFYGVKKQ